MVIAAEPSFHLDPSDPLSETFRAGVARTLTHFLDEKADTLAPLGNGVAPLLATARAFLAGGKRLRPAFCWWSAVAVDADAARPGLLEAAASLELLHVSALVHDDVMDGSDTRRGLRAAHREYAELHRAESLLGSAESFGRAGAILLGDLLLVWSAELARRSDLDARAACVLELMRTEVTAGQFLDVAAQHQPLEREVEQALADAARVVEFKSARYSVVRPCQFGALVAGGDDDAVARLETIGLPLGRAFQYRDDVLGVFGDTAVTGKPSGDDLREGKRTVLVAHAMSRADATARATLAGLLGRPDLDESEVATACSIIESSGALAAVEEMIDRDVERSVAALEDADFTTAGSTALRRLVDLATRRAA